MKYIHLHLYLNNSDRLRFIVTVMSFMITMWFTNLYGQSGINTAMGTINGEVKDFSNYPVDFARIEITSLGVITYSNEEGKFILENVPVGLKTIHVSSLGYESKEVQVSVKANEVCSLVIEVKDSILTLDEFVIEQKSEAEEKEEETIQVTVLDAKEVRDQPIGGIDLIRKSTGALIRQQGGLGSNVSVQLNGLSGRSVRIYYDGVPTEFLGGASLALNTIPINLIDRVEVYKGVLPVEIGTDALGGGINIVSRRAYEDFIEANYQVGSFNTHRFSVVGKKIINEDITIGTKAFFNYSDNDYTMKDIPNSKVKVIDNIFGRKDTIIEKSIEDVRRFHNKHRSYYLEANAQIYDKKWTDKLALNIGYVNVFDELQHGARVVRVPYGEVETSSKLLTSTLNYQKYFGDHWQISQISSFYYGSDFINDSSSNVYNWQGKILPIKDANGAELGQPTRRKGKKVGTSHRSILKYSLNEKQHVTISNIFGQNQTYGKDPLADRININGNSFDPNEIKAPTSTNILGLQYEGDWLKKDQLNVLGFYKNYFFKVESLNPNDVVSIANNLMPTVSISNSFHGVGLGLKFKFNERVFVRSSYERSTRLPDALELFGDFGQLLPNLKLKAERSHNVNVGVNYSNDQSKKFKYGVDLNLFLRDQEDLIRLEVLGESGFARHINEDRVTSRGVELTAKASPLERIACQVNFTYQDIFVSASDDIAEQSFIGARLPNVPNLFFNTSLSYTIPNLFQKDKRLSFFWNYFYVNPFSITYVLDFDHANPDNIVSRQDDHIMGIVYKDTKNGLSLSTQVNNVTNNVLFDNFRVPKPGRHITFKLSYLLNKKSKSENK